MPHAHPAVQSLQEVVEVSAVDDAQEVLAVCLGFLDLMDEGLVHAVARAGQASALAARTLAAVFRGSATVPMGVESLDLFATSA